MGIRNGFEALVLLVDDVLDLLDAVLGEDLDGLLVGLVLGNEIRHKLLGGEHWFWWFVWGIANAYKDWIHVHSIV